jgi:hypothetical protein
MTFTFLSIMPGFPPALSLQYGTHPSLAIVHLSMGFLLVIDTYLSMMVP